MQDLPEFVETVRVLVAQLPEINRTCVRLLFAFLLRVSLLSAENLMTTENLGIVFAPNLLRAPNATEMNVMDLQVGDGLLAVAVCVFFYFLFSGIDRADQ